MAQAIHDHLPIPRRRIRELARAHGRAWSQRARLLRESEWLLPPGPQELNQRTKAPLLALLEEGVPEGRWVASSSRRCVLVECQGGELILRSVRRNAVEDAPRDAQAKTVVQRSMLSKTSRYREAVTTTRRVSGWICALALGLFGVGNVAGFTLDSQATLRLAIWCLIAAMIAFVVYVLARVSVPDPVEDEPDSEGRQPTRGQTRDADSGDTDVVALTRANESVGSGMITTTGLLGSEEGADSPAVAYEEPPANQVGRGRNTTNKDYADLDISQREFLGYELSALPEGDLVEGFAQARAMPDNDAQGSDSIRVVEARGELASILGIERGEAVLEIVWATSGGGRSGHSYLPYREVVSGTSLDPQRPPSEKVRPACRHALHERLIEEKPLGALEPKVTYRIGPDSYQFFGCPMWSGGTGGQYVLEDKLKYLMERAPELEFEDGYSCGELRRMEEIASGAEYAPTHEELLRFALIAGIEPRFLFEDSGEDLRHRTRRGSDPVQPVLWRVEAAISEAHGIPVEVFERRLMDWHLAKHSWRFR